MSRHSLPLRPVHNDPHPAALAVPHLLRQPLPAAMERTLERILRHWRLPLPSWPAE